MCARGPGAGPPWRAAMAPGRERRGRGRVQRGRGAPGRREAERSAPDNERGAGSALRPRLGGAGLRGSTCAERAGCAGQVSRRAEGALAARPSRAGSRLDPGYLEPPAAACSAARPPEQPRWPAPGVSSWSTLRNGTKGRGRGRGEGAPAAPPGAAAARAPEGTGLSQPGAQRPLQLLPHADAAGPELWRRRPRRRASTGTGTATQGPGVCHLQRPLPVLRRAAHGAHPLPVGQREPAPRASAPSTPSTAAGRLSPDELLEGRRRARRWQVRAPRATGAAAGQPAAGRRRPRGLCGSLCCSTGSVCGACFHRPRAFKR